MLLLVAMAGLVSWTVAQSRYQPSKFPYQRVGSVLAWSRATATAAIRGNADHGRSLVLLDLAALDSKPSPVWTEIRRAVGASFSDDSSLLAVTHGRESSARGFELSILDASSGRELTQVPFTEGIQSASFRPGTEQLVVLTEGRILLLLPGAWRTTPTTAASRPGIAFPAPGVRVLVTEDVSMFTLSSDGTRLACCDQSGRVRVFGLDPGGDEIVLPVRLDDVGLAFSSRGDLLAVSGQERGVPGLPSVRSLVQGWRLGEEEPLLEHRILADNPRIAGILTNQEVILLHDHTHTTSLSISTGELKPFEGRPGSGRRWSTVPGGLLLSQPEPMSLVKMEDDPPLQQLIDVGADSLRLWHLPDSFGVRPRPVDESRIFLGLSVGWLVLWEFVLRQQRRHGAGLPFHVGAIVFLLLVSWLMRAHLGPSHSEVWPSPRSSALAFLFSLLLATPLAIRGLHSGREELRPYTVIGFCLAVASIFLALYLYWFWPKG